VAEGTISAYACGGRGVRGSGWTRSSTWLPPAATDEFAERHHKRLRFLNRGSIVTASLVDAVLRKRWPDPGTSLPRLGLIVGSAFGNEGETTHYFRSIRAIGAQDVAPMASFDVAVNSFVSFSSIFGGLTGPVQLLSSGAASSIDALASALSLLEGHEVDAVVIAGVEHDCPEAYAYTGRTTRSPTGSAEMVAVMLLEQVATGMVTPQGTLLSAECAFIAPSSGRQEIVLAGLIGRLRSSAHIAAESIAAVFAGPAWTGAADLVRRVVQAPEATWLDGLVAAAPWQIGATGMIGCGLALQHLSEKAEGRLGLVVVTDPGGWIGAALVRGGRPTAVVGEGPRP